MPGPPVAEADEEITAAVRYILHAGLPKTGTSTLQAFLRGNRQGLAREGVFLPAPFPEDPQGAHGAISLLLRDERIEVLTSFLRDAEAGAAAAGADKIVIIAATVSGLGAAKLQVLKKAFGAPVRLVIYYRNLWELSLSTYVQRHRQRPYIVGPAAEEVKLADPTEQIARLERCFGDVEVRVLRPEERLEPDFCAAAGIPWSDELVESPDHNRSPDLLTAVLLNRLRVGLGVDTDAAWASMAEQRWRTTEDALLGEMAPTIEGLDLSHPKLAAHRERLLRRPSYGRSDPKAYLEALISCLAQVSAGA